MRLPECTRSSTVGGNVLGYKGPTKPKRHTPPASDRLLAYGPPFARSRLPPAVALSALASCEFPLHLLHFDRGVECAPSPYGTSGFKSSRPMGALPRSGGAYELDAARARPRDRVNCRVQSTPCDYRTSVSRGPSRSLQAVISTTFEAAITVIRCTMGSSVPGAS